MGFVSYNLNYYRDALNDLETGAVTPQTIYKAKQLLKILDDLVDEGYTELYEKLEEACRGVSRLQEYLYQNRAEPFKLCVKTIESSALAYGEENLELTKAINSAVRKAKNVNADSDAPFLENLIRFCEWIGYEENSAYIFLLRDTMLPYIYYQSKNRNRIFPWLLGRKTLEFLFGKANADDEIRASVVKALEFGQYKNFNEFCDIVLPDIRKTLCKYPQAKICLTELLNQIAEKRIVVVEAGCFATFPLLLMCLDSRVDMRMYATYPYLASAYSGRVFTSKYEEIRLFETLSSQNLYFRFSGFANGHFYVNKCEDKETEEDSMREIKTMLK